MESSKCLSLHYDKNNWKTITQHCDTPEWIYCASVISEDMTTVDLNQYGDEVLNICQCWQPANTKSSLFSSEKYAGANCILDTC